MYSKLSLIKRSLIIILIFLFSNIVYGQIKTELWGLCGSGGKLGFGTIFKTNAQGENPTLQHSFVPLHKLGRYPVFTLCLASNKKLYGLTSEGGNGEGIVFVFNPNTSTISEKAFFRREIEGSSPSGKLVEGPGGLLYGLAANGGSQNMGTIFALDPISEELTTLTNFTGINGSMPNGNLLLSKDGKMYGLTGQGGSYNDGVLFEWDFSHKKLTKLWDFKEGETGKEPIGELFQTESGRIFGAALNGGKQGFGTVFEFFPNTGLVETIWSFDGENSGANPNGYFIEFLENKLLGTCRRGGLNDGGVIFEIETTESKVTKRIDFEEKISGIFPTSGLTQLESKLMFGLTSKGGNYNYGVLYKYDPLNNELKKVYDFDGVDGMYPEGEITSFEGRYFGLTKGGGQNYGAVFEFFPGSNTVEFKTDFYKGLGGLNPMGGLVMGKNQKIYGVTYREGKDFRGSLFEFNPFEKVFVVKLRLEKVHSQESFYASLTSASNGNIYGIQKSSLNYGGFLFEYKPGMDSISKKFFFNKQETGTFPVGALKELKKNKLFGMTQSGGEFGDGTLFEYDNSLNEYRVLANFLDSTTGKYPQESPVLFNNGKIYCVAFKGGKNDMGTLVEYNFDTNNLAKKFDFDSVHGANPYQMINGKNGKIYGLTIRGGIHNSGVLFEFDPVLEKLEVKYSFEELSAPNSHNSGKLTLGKNGKVYGLFSDELSINNSFLFEFDPELESMKKKFHFKDFNVGKNPWLGSLICVEFCQSFRTVDTTVCDKFISPTGKTWTKTGTYYDTLSNAGGCDSIILYNLSIPIVNTVVYKEKSTLTSYAIDSHYQWLDCSNDFNPINGETEGFFTARENGVYSVRIKQNGCVDTSECVEINNVGIQEKTDNSNFMVIPNPTDRTFQLQYENKSLSPIKISLKNVVGQTIWAKTHRANSIFSGEITGPNGVYFLKVEQEGGNIKVLKIIKTVY